MRLLDHISRVRDFYIKTILHFPRSVIAFWVSLSFLLGLNIVRLQIDPDVKALLPAEMDLVRNMNTMDELFGGMDIVVVALAADSLFSEPTLTKIAQMTAELEQQDFVDRVVSLTNAQEVHSIPDGFEVQPVMPVFPKNAAEVSALQQRLKRNDLLYGNIVSHDFKKAALIVMLKTPVDVAKDQQIYSVIADMRRRYEGPERIYVAGMPITRVEVSTNMVSDLKTLFPYGLVLMVIFLVISFRSWLGVTLPLVVTILVITQTFGLMALWAMKVTFVGVIIPVMLIAVTSSYSIHLIAYYLHELRLAPQKSQEELVTQMHHSLQVPVFLSAATTLVGFLSLRTHVLPPIREIGLLIAFGIVMSFLMSMTFIPAALILLGKPPLRLGRLEKSRLDRLLGRSGEYLIHYAKPILVLTLIGVLVLGLNIPRLKVDTNPVSFFKPDSEFRRSSQLIDRDFGGAAQIAILCQGDFQDPCFLAKVDSLAAYLERFEYVTRVNTLVDELRLMNRAFHGDSLQYDQIPASREEVAQYLLLFSMSGDQRDLDQFVDYDYQQGQILARVTECGSQHALKMYQDTEEAITQKFGRDHFPFVTGLTPLIGVLADLVVRGQIRSLLISLLLVWLMTTLIFRSIKIGAIAAVPLSIAIIVLFGLMGLLQINLDMATAMLSSILIGVGVDYTVHYIYRHRLEKRRGANEKEAIIRTLMSSGKSILFNGVSVITGFVVLMLSGFLPIYFFGFLIVVAISTCLIGALTIVPIIIYQTRPRGNVH